MPYVAGALSQLWLQATWKTDDLALLQLTQDRVTDLIAQFNCATAKNLEQLCGLLGTEGDNDMCGCLRWNDGVLQTLSCGVWTDVPGFQNQPTPPLQPANGAEQPEGGGGIACYHMTLVANQQWILPTPVSSGDQIEFSNPNGASNEAGQILWYGPQGLRFFAGKYDPGTAFTSGTDPAPSVPHQGVLALIDGSYYDLTDGLITLPGGISNAQCVILLNTDTPATLQGTVQGDVCVTNNQAITWTSTLNFLTNPYSSAIVAFYGTYSPGIGYVGVNNGASDLSVVILRIYVDAANITSMSMLYTTPGQGGPHGVVGFETDSGLYTAFITPGAETNATHTVISNRSGVNTMYAESNTGTVSGDAIISSWTITGTGIKPANLP